MELEDSAELIIELEEVPSTELELSAELDDTSELDEVAELLTFSKFATKVVSELIVT